MVSPNELTKPDGAAEVLDNCVIDFDNTVQSRRGFEEFGNKTPDDTIVKQLLTYKGRILRHYSNKLSYDFTGNGSFVDFSGNYSELVNRLRIKYFELNSNLYFTTSEGIKKISATSADDFNTSTNYITSAGGVKAISFEAEVVPSVSGFLPAQSKVAYKVLWAKKDANGNVIRGVPTSRYVITNNSQDVNTGESFKISVTDDGAGIHKQFNSTDDVAGAVITIPSHGFVAGDKVRFYGDIPEELDKNLDYFIVNVTNPDVFGVSLSSGEGETAITLTDKVGTGTVYSGINNSHFFTFDTPTNKFACWFNISGEDTPPTDTNLVGRSLREVEIYRVAIKNKQNYMARIAQTIFSISDIEVTTSINDVTVKNIDGGNVLNASAGNIPSELLVISDIVDGQTSTGVTANVNLKIPVPTDILTANDKLYFFEIYRTAIITASVGAGLEIIDPGEEFQKIYEAPVEVNEITNLINSEIVHLDNVPESFRQGGAFLYTNPVSGEGILQANEAPPVAHDVAVFKGSAFYANTREKHKLQFNLLDVSQFPKTLSYSINSSTAVSSGAINIPNHLLSNGNPVKFTGTPPNGLTAGTLYYIVDVVNVEDENNILRGVSVKLSTSLGGSAIAITPRTGTCTLVTETFKLYVANSGAVKEYSFVGRPQIIEFTVKKRSDTVGGSYFDIKSAQNRVSYRVWFDKGTIEKSWLDTDVNITSNRITISAHGLATNDLVTISGTTTLTPGDYYIIRVDDDTIQLKSTIAGSAIDLTAAEAGTLKHISKAPTSDTSVILKIIMQNFDNTTDGAISAFKDAFTDIFDFDIVKVSSTVVRVNYTDNGATDTVVYSNPSPSWNNPVITQTGLGENASANQILLSGLASQGLAVEDTARSIERVINKDTTSIVNAFYLSGLEDLPGILLFEAKSLLDNEFYLGFNYQTNTPVFNPALPIARTVTNVSNTSVFTTSTNHGFTANQQIYTFIKPTSLPILVSGAKTINTTPANNTFTLLDFSTTTAYSSFERAIVFSAEVVSDNSVNPNRIYFSKINQPEAVPLVNFIDIGPRDKAIQRILALRDSLIVLKEDGVYVISGSAAPNFSVRLSDSSALTLAPDTATNLNNLIYVLTSQGVVTVSETGVGVISRNIENKIQEVANAKFDYKLMSWGMASESDRCYLLWLPEKTTDSFATQAFRYNTFTRTWTRWTKPANCGVVNLVEDKIFLGDAFDGPYVLKERKNFERQDYADREIVRGIGTNAINGTTYTISSVFDLAPGDVLVQKQYLDINKFNRTLKKLDRDNLLSSNYFRDFKASIGNNIADNLLRMANQLIADGVVVPVPSNTNNIDVIRSEFNAIIDILNLISTPTMFKNYKRADELLNYETLVVDVDPRTNSVEVKQTNKFLQGDVSFFKGIKCIVQYAPQHFGKPEATKQIPDGTLIFDQNNFWGGVVAYASDRSYDFAPISFSGRGPGYWDGYSWANATFGGEGNEVPVRTLIPRDKARCRYLHVQFTHVNAREEWKLIGVSLEPREVSARGYR